MEQQFEELKDAATTAAHDREALVKLIVRDERGNVIVTSWEAGMLDGIRLAAHQMAAMAEERNLDGYALMVRIGNAWETTMLAKVGHPGRCYLITPLDFEQIYMCQIDDAAPSCLDDQGAFENHKSILAGLLVERKDLHKRLVKANIWKGQAK